MPKADTPDKAVKVTLNNLTLKDRYVPNCVGGIFNRLGGKIFTLNHCKFINNSSGQSSGAVDNHSKLIINNSLSENNTCLIGAFIYLPNIQSIYMYHVLLN